jgi:hypothetical protein
MLKILLKTPKTFSKPSFPSDFTLHFGLATFEKNLHPSGKNGDLS